MPTVQEKYRDTKQYVLVMCELIAAAKYRGFVTYQEVAKLIGLPLQGNLMGKEIGQLLGEISEDECRKGRPMLSAIVVNTEGHPGPGFFALARQLDKLATSASRDQELAFWRGEKLALYETWRVILHGES